MTNRRNVVIGLYQKDIHQSSRSHINASLNKVLDQLRNSRPKVETKVAFVFGKGGVQDFRWIEEIGETYAEPVSESGDFTNLWLMGQALLEKEARFGAKNLFLLLTDHCINERQAESVLSTPILARFKELDARLILIKGTSYVDEKLEAYVRRHGSVVSVES